MTRVGRIPSLRRDILQEEVRIAMRLESFATTGAVTGAILATTALAAH